MAPRRPRPLRRLSASLVAWSLGACTAHQPREEPGDATKEGPLPPPPEPVAPEPVAPEPVPPPVQAVDPPDNCFTGRVDRALGRWPLNGVFSDVDGDGRRDVIINYSLDRVVGVLLNHGDGGFAKEIDVPLQHDAVGVMVGDVDGDGRLDLAAADYRGQSVRVHLGRGDGTFTAGAIETRVGKYVGAGSIADLDGDGKSDLVVTLWSALGVLRGRGDGTFGAVQRHPSGQAPEGPLALDLSGDGRLDLATPSNDEHHLAVFLGRGGGRFSAATRTPCGQGGHSLVAADFDGDGATDLAMADLHSSDVCVFRGDGRGGFGVYSVVPAGRATYGLATADLTGDGRLDLAVIAWGAAPRTKDERRDVAALLGDGVLFVFAGDGRGAFAEIADIAVGTSPNEVWLDDIDGDGRLDALTLNSNGRSLTQLRGVACEPPLPPKK